MNKLLKIQQNNLPLILSLLLIVSLIVLIKSPLFSSNLTPYVIIDFLITIPLIHYFLIRKKEKSKKVVFSIFILGFILTSILIPTNQQGVFSQFSPLLFGLLEVYLLGYIIYKTRKAIKEVKALNNSSLDFYDTMVTVCNKIIPFKLGAILASEIAVIYYGLIQWKKRPLQTNEFSYHKDGMAISILLGFLLVVAVEIFVTHSMMQHGNVSGSIILAILSGYTLLQVIAVMKSLAKRPIYIDKQNKVLLLRFGILSNAKIPFEIIDTIEVSTKEIPEDSPIKFFAPVGRAGGHNIILYFNQTLKFNGFYGIPKKANSLAFLVDEKEEFKNSLNTYLKQ